MSDYTVRNTKNNIYFCFAGKGVKALKLSSILVFLQITFENHLWELSLRIIFENYLWELALRIIFENYLWDFAKDCKSVFCLWIRRTELLKQQYLEILVTLYRRKIVKIVSLFQTSPSSQVEMWEGTELRTVLRMDNTYIYIYLQ